LAELVRTGQATPQELLDEAIHHIDLLNPQLNAVVHKMYDRARAEVAAGLPNGPFAGVPFLVKDLVPSTVAGEPQSNGTRLLRNWGPAQDSELVRRWRAAGLVVVGKTNTPEFGLVPYTESVALGVARNPYDLTRTPGGSSGGSAAAVAARMVPMAGGGDGGGSIRIPAACCGLFGLKPTRGRTPMGPDVTEGWGGCVVEHVLTRSVRDSAALLDATAGPDVGAPYVAPPQERLFLDEVNRAPGKLRIAFTSRALIGAQVAVDPEILRGLDATVGLLQDLGHELVEEAPATNPEELAVAFLEMLAAQLWNDMEEAAAVVGRKPARGDFELATWVLGLVGRALSGADYVRAVRVLQRTARRLGEFFARYDVLLTPSLAQLPVPIGALQPTGAERQLLGAIGALRAGKLLTRLNLVRPTALKTFAFIPYAPPFNVTGQPAMSVPLHWTARGLPVGMQFVGRFGDEATLFRLAGELEQAQPWTGRMPALVAESATGQTP
jgi:amidase